MRCFLPRYDLLSEGNADHSSVVRAGQVPCSRAEYRNSIVCDLRNLHKQFEQWDNRIVYLKLLGFAILKCLKSTLRLILKDYSPSLFTKSWLLLQAIPERPRLISAGSGRPLTGLPPLYCAVAQSLVSWEKRSPESRENPLLGFVSWPKRTMYRAECFSCV